MHACRWCGASGRMGRVVKGVILKFDKPVAPKAPEQVVGAGFSALHHRNPAGDTTAVAGVGSTTVNRSLGDISQFVQHCEHDVWGRITLPNSRL